VVHVQVEKPMAFLDEVQLRSPGALINDTVIFGSTFIEDYRVDQPSGKVRAFDVRTGALRWEYDPIPRDPADPAYATWGKAAPPIRAPPMSGRSSRWTRGTISCFCRHRPPRPNISAAIVRVTTNGPARS